MIKTLEVRVWRGGGRVVTVLGGGVMAVLGGGVMAVLGGGVKAVLGIVEEMDANILKGKCCHL